MRKPQSRLSGEPTSGSDYFAEDLEVDLPANAETVTVTFQT